MVSFAKFVALVSYYCTLWFTPTASVSLLIWVYNSPRLLAVYKAYKATLRVILRHGSELERVLSVDKNIELFEGKPQLDDDEPEDQHDIVNVGQSGESAKPGHENDGDTEPLLSAQSIASCSDQAIVVDRRNIEEWRIGERRFHPDLMLRLLMPNGIVFSQIKASGVLARSLWEIILRRYCLKLKIGPLPPRAPTLPSQRQQ